MSLNRMVASGSINTTPDKTEVKTTSNSISVKNVGCKGVIKKREACKTCQRLGIYQAGILAWSHCCNREDGWRKLSGITEKPCKFYLEKGKVEELV